MSSLLEQKFLWIIKPEIESDAVDGSGEGEAAECQEDQDKVGKQRGEVYHVTARLHALWTTEGLQD